MGFQEKRLFPVWLVDWAQSLSVSRETLIPRFKLSRDSGHFVGPLQRDLKRNEYDS
jgi:hypothetical protein